MSTDLEHRVREALHERAQRARLVHPDQPPGPEVVSISETPLRARSGRRLVALAAAIALIAGAALVVIKTAGHRTTHVTTTPSTATTPGWTDTACSLTGAQISRALGSPVTSDSKEPCYFNGGHGIFPDASYRYVGASACTPQGLRKEEFVDAVHGLNIDAYSMRSGLGVSVIFCNGDQSLRVNVEASGDDLVSATAIAKLILNDLTGTPTTSPAPLG